MSAASQVGHEAEVTCVDWCPVGWKLATCADDMRHRLWELDNEDRVEPSDLAGWADMRPRAYDDDVGRRRPYREDAKLDGFHELQMVSCIMSDVQGTQWTAKSRSEGLRPFGKMYQDVVTRAGPDGTVRVCRC